MVKNLPCNAGDGVSIPGRGTKIPHAAGQPSCSPQLLSPQQSLSHVRLIVTPWTVACQASPPMGFSRQEHWSGLPLPSPGDLPNPGTEPGSPALQADFTV